MQSLKILAAAVTAAALANTSLAQCSSYSLTPSGTNLAAGDDTVRVVGLPFGFPFQGTVYHQLTIGSNGWIKLGSLPTSASEFADSEATMLSGAPRIAVAWDDLDPSASGSVSFAADATQASIVWKNVPSFATGTALIEAECVLLPNGEIDLVYDASSNFATNNSSCIVGISAGNGAPVSPHSWSAELASQPIAVSTGTGYQLFAALGFDLAGTTLKFTPVGANDFSVTSTTLAPCAPTVLPPLAGATTTLVGAGCPAAVPNGSIYELFDATTGANPFDLANTSLRFARSVNSYTVAPGAGFDLAYATNGAIEPAAGDDTMHNYPLAMGSFPFGTQAVTSVSLSSNGYLWLGSSTSQQFNASAANFNAGIARVSAYWKDLVPNASTAPIYIENTASVFRATWANVPQFSGGGLQTFQIALDHASGDISISFLAVTGTVTSSPPLVGITGGASTNLGNSNLATAGVANATTRVITGGSAPMAYTVNAAPRIGQDFVMTSTIPSINNGIGAFVLGASNPSLPLDAYLGAGSAPGCSVYTDILFEPYFVYSTPGVTSFSVTIPVPYDVNLTGLSLQSQAFGFSALNGAGLLSSNGRSFTTGL